MRDNSKVIELAGYREAANSPVEIYLEKNGKSIILSCNSKRIGIYTEEDPSPVTGVAVSAPPGRAALYSWAGAFVPEASAEGPIDQESDVTDVPDSEETAAQSWESYNPSSNGSTLLNGNYGAQANPADNIDPTTIPSTEAIPEPPPPPPPPNLQPNPWNQVWIVVNPGTYVINANTVYHNDGGSEEVQNYVGNGIALTPNVSVVDAAMQHVIEQHNQEQQALFEQGELAPETYNEPNPFNGFKPSFYVTVNTHIIGDFSTEATSAAAVLTVQAQVTDANGNVVFETKINGVGSEGHDTDYYHVQAAQAVNDYLQTVIGK